MGKRNYRFEIEPDADGGWVVSDTYTDVHGVGDTVLDALTDYADALIEYVSERVDAELETTP